MLLQASHTTTHLYAGPVVESHNEVRLAPSSDRHQRVIEFSIVVSPDAEVFEYDTLSGRVHHFGIRQPHESLVVSARCTVECLNQNPFETLDMLSEDVDFYALEGVKQSFAEYLAASPFVPLTDGLRQLAAEAPLKQTRNASERIRGIKQWVYRELDYIQGVTDVTSTASEVAMHRAGVCQDYAHLMLALARCQGIPSRYVSGYLYAGSDQSLRGDQATHAWVECLLPDGTWLGVDPTNGMLTNDHYIRVHTGVDYSEALPSKGTYVGPKTTSLEVSVEVHDITTSAPV